jgi:hypothetical protein
MSKRVVVVLPPGWEPLENPDGPPTYARPDGSGAFQVSLTEFVSGETPNPSTSDLIDLSTTIALNHHLQVASTDSGPCRMGLFGLVRGSDGEFTHLIWHLSNGRDFILATFIAADPPESELREASDIVMKLHLVP